MSILCSATDAVICPILFKVLTLSIAICTVHLHLSNFCLSSGADFSNSGARILTSAEHTPCLPAQRANQFGYMVSVSYGNLLMAVFHLINRHHPYRWLNYVIRPLICRFLLPSIRWSLLLPMAPWGKKKSSLLFLKF